MLQSGFVGTTRKRSSCDPAKGAAPEQHMVLGQVSSGQRWLWRRKLPLLSHNAEGHVPAGHKTSIGSCGTSFIMCALPCLKEEVVKGLILPITTFCLSAETQCGEESLQSMGLTAAPQGMATVPLPAPGEWRNSWVPRSGGAQPCQ